jgi:murein DD-endopeptidase MepM/ murein hydrolase activator NlpD
MDKKNNPFLLLHELEAYFTPEETARLGTHLISVLMVLFVAWIMQLFYLHSLPLELASSPSITTQPVKSPGVLPNQIIPTPLPLEGNPEEGVGIQRAAQIHTTMPNRPRITVMKYSVLQGDNIFSIADKFGLHPSSILYGNSLTLRDDPHLLKAGQVLNIMPMNGAYYEWNPGEGLDIIADSYHVNTSNIIKWAGNRISDNEIGNISNPNLKAGTWLFIPGGTRAYTTQGVPYITRKDPKKGKILGTSICDATKGGPIGTGILIWPSANHHLSGYPYAPDANHLGIDIAGKIGDPILAVDFGVVVYSGPSGRFGNAVVIDHGNGWQSFYGFLNKIGAACGQYISQGDLSGDVGTANDTLGGMLHFEYMSDKGYVDPMNFLPK